MNKRGNNVCGKRIKLARIDNEMAQIDLATALNVDFNIDITQNGISELERGVRQVKDFEIVAFAEILDVNPLWLLYGDKTPLKYLNQASDFNGDIPTTKMQD